MSIQDSTLYITGAGVSAESGIPTFRGEDGYWTIGSQNYTPQEMATRRMYENHPVEFLKWYYHRFATYRHHGPNSVHHWLADKTLITQNIDGLDAKAGNQQVIPIHGQLDSMLIYDNQDTLQAVIPTPWDKVDDNEIDGSLLSIFHIDPMTQIPEMGSSYKPFVLLFDEYYTEQFRIEEAQQRMFSCERMIFMGTSFSVNITQMALSVAQQRNIPVEIVDPSPVQLPLANITYHTMTASEFIQTQ